MRYFCVPEHFTNIKSRLKLYLVDEGTDVEKYFNYEIVLPIKHTKSKNKINSSVTKHTLSCYLPC